MKYQCDYVFLGKLDLNMFFCVARHSYGKKTNKSTEDISLCFPLTF